MASSRATTAWGICSSVPSPVLVWRYSSKRSRAPIQRICRGTGLYGALDYAWWLRVLAEEVRPLCAYIGVGEQNCAFASCADTRKVLLVAIADVDEICFYSAGVVAGDQPTATRRTEILAASKTLRVSAQLAKAQFLLAHTDVGAKWADLFSEYTQPPGVIERSVKAGAAAILWMGARERCCYIATPTLATEHWSRFPRQWSRAKMPCGWREQ